MPIQGLLTPAQWSRTATVRADLPWAPCQTRAHLPHREGQQCQGVARAPRLWADDAHAAVDGQLAEGAACNTTAAVSPRARAACSRSMAPTAPTLQRTTSSHQRAPVQLPSARLLLALSFAGLSLPQADPGLRPRQHCLHRGPQALGQPARVDGPARQARLLSNAFHRLLHPRGPVRRDTVAHLLAAARVRSCKSVRAAGVSGRATPAQALPEMSAGSEFTAEVASPAAKRKR